MSECRECDAPCYYTYCNRCMDAQEREAKTIARAEEWEA